jgi:hypothetical protein
MLLAYVDESYDDSRYWIAACLVRGDAIAPLTAQLDGIVSAAGLDPAAELHGREMFRGEAPWNIDVTRRIEAYRAAFAAIAAHDVEVIIRGVDIPRLEARYRYPREPHSIVLEHLLERIQERNRAAFRGGPVLVIADDIKTASVHRRDLWTFQRHATTGYRSSQLTDIVDTIHFTPSHSSRLLQAADLVAYLWRRMDDRRRQGLDERADRTNAEIWRLVQQRVTHCLCWEP